MRSYLHRLVHSVAHTRPTIHPRTMPLFAPHRETPDETAVIHPAPTSSPKSSESAAPVPASMPDAVPIDHPPPPFLFHRIAHQPPQPATPGGTTPIERPERIEASVPVARQLDSEAPRPLPDLTPLLPAQPAEATVTATPRLSAAAAPKKQIRPAVEARSARVERQRDEIQIHIGRIEVTAVPPPAPRAPKAPDKAVSLDAYLERRNGRVR